MIPNPDETFEDFLDQNEHLIRRLARDGRWRIPWQETEETEADLALVLYQAYVGHKPSIGPYQGFFNTLWSRFRARAIRNALRGKRSATIIVTPYSPLAHHRGGDDMSHLESVMGDAALDLGVVPIMDLPIEGLDPLEHAVWRNIQRGYTPTEIINMLPIPRIRYYHLIKAWKQRLRRDLEGERQ